MRLTNPTILIIALLICALGLVSIYSASYQKETGFWGSLCQRQMLWVLIGLALFFFFSNFNYRRLWDATYALYILATLLLFLVFMLGVVHLGAQRWLKFGWFNFQPSEAAKLVIVIFLARYYSAKSVRDFSLQVRRMGLVRSLILPFCLIIVPVGLIIEQPDLGSGVIVMLIFFAMLYLAGVRLRYIILLLILAAFTLPLFWHFLKDYQRDRLLVFLNPNIDPLGAGYTVIQSKIAIGSGGFLGKGWLAGTQSQLRFLPEAHTDFIFATFAEEWGFLGNCVLLGLYYLLTREAIRIAYRTSDNFGKNLSLGISCMLIIQAAINIAMNLGLAPVVGVPLFLMSYGGSSVVMTFIALGILANVDKRRTVF